MTEILFAYRAAAVCPHCHGEADVVFDGTTVYAATGTILSDPGTGWQTGAVKRFREVLQVACLNMRQPGPEHCGYVLTFDTSTPETWVAVTPDLGRLLAHGTPVHNQIGA